MTAEQHPPDRPSHGGDSHAHGHPAHGAHHHGHDTHDHDAHGLDAHGHEGHDGHDGHGRTVLSRARHAVSEVFGGHSHDAADQVDESLETHADGRRALLLSLLVLAVTAGAPGRRRGAVRVGRAARRHPAQRRRRAHRGAAAGRVPARSAGRRPSGYTYGYGRAEDLAGLFIVAMIALSASLAACEAVDRLLHPPRSPTCGRSPPPAVVGFAGNELVARYRIRVGRRIGSAALVADGLHARTDGFTSLAVAARRRRRRARLALGRPGRRSGHHRRDHRRAAPAPPARSARRLMDAVDPALVDQATAAVASVDGVDEVRELRLRWIGHTLRAEADATVSPQLSLTEAHDLAHHAEAHLLSRVRRLTAATVHTSPTGAHP